MYENNTNGLPKMSLELIIAMAKITAFNYPEYSLGDRLSILAQSDIDLIYITSDKFDDGIWVIVKKYDVGALLGEFKKCDLGDFDSIEISSADYELNVSEINSYAIKHLMFNNNEDIVSSLSSDKGVVHMISPKCNSEMYNVEHFFGMCEDFQIIGVNSDILISKFTDIGLDSHIIDLEKKGVYLLGDSIYKEFKPDTVGVFTSEEKEVFIEFFKKDNCFCNLAIRGSDSDINHLKERFLDLSEVAVISGHVSLSVRAKNMFLNKTFSLIDNDDKVMINAVIDNRNFKIFALESDTIEFLSLFGNIAPLISKDVYKTLTSSDPVEVSSDIYFMSTLIKDVDVKNFKFN
jgi:hypothetical protein